MWYSLSERDKGPEDFSEPQTAHQPLDDASVWISILNCNCFIEVEFIIFLFHQSNSGERSSETRTISS